MALAAGEKAKSEPLGSAVADDRGIITWAALDEVLNRGTNALMAEELGADRRVAVFARNGAETVLAYLISLHAGVSAVPVSAQLVADEVVYILEDSGARVLFAGPGTLDVAIDAAQRVGGIKVIAWRCEPRASTTGPIASTTGTSGIQNVMPSRLRNWY